MSQLNATEEKIRCFLETLAASGVTDMAKLGYRYALALCQERSHPRDASDDMMAAAIFLYHATRELRQTADHMNQEHTCQVTSKAEALSFYPIEGNDSEGSAVVTIGHFDCRARFVFVTNEDAYAGYQALTKITDMSIE